MGVWLILFVGPLPKVREGKEYPSPKLKGGSSKHFLNSMSEDYF